MKFDCYVVIYERASKVKVQQVPRARRAYVVMPTDDDLRLHFIVTSLGFDPDQQAGVKSRGNAYYQ